MADIKILEDDCGGERGKRGHRGPTGPTGPSGSGSAGIQLKFSGIIQVLDLDQTTHLGDTGPALASSDIALAYPAAQAGTLKDLAVNISEAFLIPVDGEITVQLFLNGVAVPGFAVTWGPGETTGLKSVVTSPLAIAANDLIDLQVHALNITTTDSFTIAATIGSGS